MRALRASLTTSLRRLLQLCTSRGPREALRRFTLRNKPLLLYPRDLPAAIHPFDLAYGVDTSGFRHGELLGSSGAKGTPRLHGSDVWNTAYYGVAPSIFDHALALTAIRDWSGFTFVDIGCGKGRALMLASRLPFRNILGVELDAGLAAIAKQNLRIFHAPWQQCHAIDARHLDALQLDIPETPLVVYLYHPFLAPSLKRLVRRLEQSVRAHPRELWLIYINPEAATALKQFPFLRERARATVVLSPEDTLPDRLGSTQEDVAIYHFDPFA